MLENTKIRIGEFVSSTLYDFCYKTLICFRFAFLISEKPAKGEINAFYRVAQLSGLGRNKLFSRQNDKVQHLIFFRSSIPIPFLDINF